MFGLKSRLLLKAKVDDLDVGKLKFFPIDLKKVRLQLL